MPQLKFPDVTRHESNAAASSDRGSVKEGINDMRVILTDPHRSVLY
jgi:hypothetical protein